MNRMQKISWLMVISMGLALLTSGIAVAVLAPKYGFPRASAGFAFLAIGGVGGLGPLIFRKDPGPIAYDERDRAIQLKASRAGFGSSYLVFGLICMGIWQHLGPKGMVSTNVLPLIWTLAAMTCFFVTGLTTLVLYGRRGADS